MKKYFHTASFILNGIFVVLLGLEHREDLLQLFKDPKEKVTIVQFGDSIISNGNWNDLLGRSDVQNSGFGGFTTSHLVWLIKRNVIAYDPEICFIEGGINDISVGIPMERIKANYQGLIDTLMSNDITPIVQSTLYQVDQPKSKVMIDSLNNFLMAYCAQKSIRYLDVNSRLSDEKGLKSEYSTDGTHINKKAYLIWAEEIKKVLKTK